MRQLAEALPVSKKGHHIRCCEGTSFVVRSDSGGNIINVKLAFTGEHAEEVSDQERLLHDLLPLRRLEDFDRRLVAELCLDDIVKRVKVDTVVALFDAADVFHLRQVVHLLVVHADDASFVELEEAAVFVDDDAFDLATVDKNHAQEQHNHSNQVLPPVPFAVSFENGAMVSK